MDYKDNLNTDSFKTMKKVGGCEEGKNDRKGEVLLSESRVRRHHRGAQGGNDLPE